VIVPFKISNVLTASVIIKLIRYYLFHLTMLALKKKSIHQCKKKKP